MGKTGYSKEELNARYYQGFADGVKEIETKYRHLEKQGLLLRLLVKVGDTIWYVDDDDDNYPLEAKVTRIEIKEHYILYYAEGKEDCETIGFDSDDIEKTIFLTQDKAEQKLKEMESDGYDNN